ncbi:ParB/RepB/Spo0J family partition protein, partial [Bacteroidota bacterium]
MAKKSALGRGLGALMEDAPSERYIEVENFSEINLDKIELNPFQPRQDMEEDSLLELTNSIREHGVIQPITVRKLNNGNFQLITGERRFRASKMAKLDSIPSYIRDADDNSMLELALIENIQREDLNAIEIAISYQRLIEECKLTQESLSERVGKKRATIANYLRLLKLPPEIQLGIKDKKISMGHARTLINVLNEVAQLKIFEKIIKEDLSVRKTEEMVRNLNNVKEKVSNVKKLLSEEYSHLKDRLSNHFSSKVEFSRSDNGKGKIILHFNSDEELERIL